MLVGPKTSRHRRRLVGREAEFNSWDVVLRRPDRSPRTLVVIADPGLGKSRLLTELRDHAIDLGHTVLTAQGRQLRPPRPFATLAAALDPYVARHRDAPGVSTILDEFASELRPLVPSSTARATVPGPPATQRRVTAARILLEALADQSPLALIIDDLQWADEGTLDLLGQLCRRPPTGVVFGLAYRPRQTPGTFTAVVDAMLVAGDAISQPLAPLSVGETRKLLADDIQDLDAHRLHALSGGIPQYLLALAADHGRSPTNAGISAPLQAELAPLNEPTLLVAQAASVLGPDFDPALIPAVTDLPSQEVVMALDDLERRDILRFSETPGRLAFRHRLVCDAVYETSGGGWRRLAHLRAAQALRDSHASAVLWAHHVEQSATVGDRDAIEVLVRAGDSARWTSPASAARWYRSALRLLPDDAGSNSRRAELMVAQAEAGLDAGALQESREVFLNALRDAELPSALRSRARLGAAKAAEYSGRYAEADAVLSAEIDACVTRPSATATRLVQHRALTRWFEGDRVGARRDVNRLLSEAAPLGRTSIGVASRCVAAYVLVLDGDLRAGSHHADLAGEAIDSMPDAALLEDVIVVAWCSWALLVSGRADSTIARLVRAVALARQSEQVLALALLLTVHGHALRRLGRLAEARRALLEAFELARLLDSDHLALLSSAVLVEVVLLQGDRPEAARFADAVRLKERSGTNWVTACCVEANGRVLLDADEALSCLEAVMRGCGGVELAGLHPTGRSATFELLVRAALARGDRILTRQLVAGAVKASQELGGSAAAYSALAESRLLLDRGDSAAAVERAATAEQLFTTVPMPVEAALARVVLSSALRADGKRSAAVSELRAAHQAFTIAGAVRLEEAAIRELRRHGVHYSPTSSKHQPEERLGTLSRREYEVAGHVARGLTNREIATAMFLSEKTVERHLSSIFTKLNVRSRVRLATFLYGSEVITPPESCLP
ncbi:helix-turn-helix transcriptional regulator [Kribbella sindirgiensis]|uniref:Helix-turn-helix transcriptional regulator n=1 Tax=Kribbella sindirgiensis TaxID=1124744 RepID=A0A4R0IMR1_9ACTN|nr:AAA family ATPase [Kribbella sindirgiensis]TCC34901.1 helix-turn-helix transcriptional regulator [Kribbella sindirgiensis]